MNTAIARLVAAVGYPGKVSEGVASFVLSVDGAEIYAEERDGRLVLRRPLSADTSILPVLAGYAAGRILKEDAVLSWQSDGGAFLWQEAPADAGSGELRRFFESFLDSCDWWRARVDALRGGDAPGTAEDELLMIRP